MPNPRPLAPDLAEASRHVARWRRDQPGRPLPSAIRLVVTRLASVHGAAATSRALGVGAVGSARAGATPSQARSPSPTFVELSPGRPPSEVVVELENGHGATMRVRVPGSGATSLPVERLVRAFLGRPS